MNTISGLNIHSFITGSPGTYYVPHTNYDFDKPPIRRHMRRVIDLVAEAESEEVNRKYGITRKSILLRLRSLHFNRSFPADIIHYVLQNITPMLYRLWNRTKLTIDN